MGFSSTSNRPRRQLHHILHHHQLFLQKRLSILYPNQISVSPRQQIHLRIQLINRQVNALLPFAFCWPELRPIRQNRFASRLILFRNVDNKTRRHPLERSRIQNLERPVWRALNRQLLQPRQKTSFVSKCGSMIVIRMPRLPVRQYHRSRPPLPNHRRQPQLMLPRWAAHPNPVPPNSPATKPSKFSPPAPPLSRASRDFPASPSHLLSNPESRSCIPSRPSSATFLHTSAPRHPDAPQSLIRPISFRSSPHRRGL